VSARQSGLLQRLERWGTAAENASLVVLLGAMMILAVGQIVMRIFFSTGVMWGDELLKLLVLWMAMIASIAASRSDRHLRIDIISHFVPKKYARLPRLLVDAFAASICGVLAWQSWRFIQLSIEFEDTVLVGVPSWIAHSILPFAFALMCYRFFLDFVAGSVNFFKVDTQ